ncbi:MAG: tRNA (adenosine(37)-N6)-threonylcarbamoyltransferase complex dimerization subunit type 1 TsaB [Bacilli bacterium]|jgi:tRNA threonylcarbamoyladenosine biosynthesis protein TsaB
MKYLFIDSSTDILTIALTNDDDILGNINYNATNKHSKYIMQGLKELFEETGIKKEKIDKIFVINGPGSFTGIRIGVALAKVYAWALKKEVIPISTLKAYALSSLEEANNYVSVIDARRGYVYAGLYKKDYQEIFKPCYIKIDLLKKRINRLKGSITINGNINICSINKTNEVSLDVMKIINYYKHENPVNPHLLNPQYLKKTEVEGNLSR